MTVLPTLYPLKISPKKENIPGTIIVKKLWKMVMSSNIQKSLPPSNSLVLQISD